MKEVELKSVEFGYDPKKIVLEKIDLAILNKNLVAVTGPNGGEKSTLFQLILGLLKPLKGEVFVKGQHPQIRTDLVGYVPQNSKSNHHFPLRWVMLYCWAVKKAESGVGGSQRKLEKDQSRYWRK